MEGNRGTGSRDDPQRLYYERTHCKTEGKVRRTERTGRTSRALIEAGRRGERGAGVENGAIDGGVV